MTALALINLGYGNLGSVGLAFERLGLTPIVTDDPQTIAQADKVVLPGVGAAGFAMARIEALNLRPVLTSLRQPLLGICLGMQLLFERSEEEENVACLGLLPGAVTRLEPAPGRPVPHMGWSKVRILEGTPEKPLPVAGRGWGGGASPPGLASKNSFRPQTQPVPTQPSPQGGGLEEVRTSFALQDGDYVYFAHSYACPDGPHTAAAADYGRHIPAAVRHAHIWGAQFHPEKSAEPGRRFLEAFLAA